MSKKLVLSAALGVLSCVFAAGCCHRGACGGGGSCASCGSHGYPASGYGPEYASAEEGYDDLAGSEPAAVTAQRPKSHCRDGSCPY